MRPVYASRSYQGDEQEEIDGATVCSILRMRKCLQNCSMVKLHGKRLTATNLMSHNIYYVKFYLCFDIKRM